MDCGSGFPGASRAQSKKENFQAGTRNQISGGCLRNLLKPSLFPAPGVKALGLPLMAFVLLALGYWVGKGQSGKKDQRHPASARHGKPDTSLTQPTYTAGNQIPQEGGGRYQSRNDEVSHEEYMKLLNNIENVTNDWYRQDQENYQYYLGQ